MPEWQGVNLSQHLTQTHRVGASRMSETVADSGETRSKRASTAASTKAAPVSLREVTAAIRWRDLMPSCLHANTS